MSGGPAGGTCEAKPPGGHPGGREGGRHGTIPAPKCSDTDEARRATRLNCLFFSALLSLRQAAARLTRQLLGRSPPADHEGGTSSYFYWGRMTLGGKFWGSLRLWGDARLGKGGGSGSGVCDGVLGCIGNTPLIRIASLSKQTGCEVRRKSESESNIWGTR